MSKAQCQRCGELTEEQHYHGAMQAVGLFPFDPLLCKGCFTALEYLLENVTVSSHAEAFREIKAWYMRGYPS